MKWGFVPKDIPKPKYLLINADESEPGTFKDHVLLERNPHLMLEGCIIGCRAIGAKVCYIYIRGEFYHLQRAARSRDRQGARRRLSRAEHPRQRPGLRDLRAPRRRRLRGRRRDRADRVARGQARAAADQAAVSRPSSASTAARRWSTTSRRSATCRRSSSAAPDWFAGHRAREEPGPEAVLRQRPRQEARASTRRTWA